jgi:hypothetical protein
MTKTLLLATALLLTTACSTKNGPESSTSALVGDTKEMKSLKSALDLYTKATINNDVSTLMNFVYPKVFTVVPKEKMTEVLTRAYASGKVPVVKDVKHLKVEPIEKYATGMFTFINSTMSTELKSPRPDNAKFEEYMLEMLTKQLAPKGGTVSFDKDKHIYTVNHSDKTLAINENDGWKFAGVNQAKKYAQKGLLPQEIVSKLN